MNRSTTRTWSASSAYEVGRQFPHGLTWRDRWAAYRDLLRREGIRGELHDLLIVAWNLGNLIWRTRRA